MTQHTPEAEALADSILKSSGSNLKNYTMAKTREAILAAAQAGIDNARDDLLIALTNVLAQCDRLATYPVGLVNAINNANDVIRKVTTAQPQE